MKRSSEIITGLSLTIVSILVVVAVGEAFLRLALFSDSFPVPALRQSWRYADSSYEDDYWKLAFLFNASEKAQRVGYIDPKLGWAMEKSPDNPLGLVSDTPYSITDIRRPLLFYGDSFVAGASPVPDRIPQVMDQLLPERSVLNYGVGGYGVDQIFLRYADTVGDFNRPTVLIGILTSDLDRSILGMRTGQKPYFNIQDDTLVTQNLPILATTREYVDSHPPGINSYFIRFLMFRLRPLLPAEWFDRVYSFDEKHRKKLAVNGKILQELGRDASERGLSMGVVIFYSQEELPKTGWREKFLKETLQTLKIPYLDTRILLSEYASDQGMQLDDLYYSDNGHPNELGNEAVARGVVRWLDSLEEKQPGQELPDSSRLSPGYTGS